MIGLLAAAFEVLAGVPKLQIPQPPDVSSVVQGLAQQFVAMATVVLTAIDSTVIDISRLAWVSILIIGVLLYYTHAATRLGKDLIKGGILLAVLAELVFPAISRL